MKRTTLNAIVDMIAFFPLFVTAITGIIIWLYLPRGLAIGALGTVASHQTFLGVQRQIWLDVHTYLGLVFTALVAIHLVLHWYYIKHLPQRFAGTKTKERSLYETLFSPPAYRYSNSSSRSSCRLRIKSLTIEHESSKKRFSNSLD